MRFPSQLLVLILSPDKRQPRKIRKRHDDDPNDPHDVDALGWIPTSSGRRPLVCIAFVHVVKRKGDDGQPYDNVQVVLRRARTWCGRLDIVNIKPDEHLNDV